MCSFAEIIYFNTVISFCSSRAVFDAARRVTTLHERGTDGIRPDCGGEVIEKAPCEESDCGESGGNGGGTSIIGRNGGSSGGGGGD